MIFDTIYQFYYSILFSADGVSDFWCSGFFELGNGTQIFWIDYFCVLGTIITIALGVVALFRILGGVLRLFKV